MFEIYTSCVLLIRFSYVCINVIFFSAAKILMAYFNLQIFLLGLSDQYLSEQYLTLLFEGSD